MPSSKYVVTREQQEIFDYYPLGMVITAPAGCGKTEALAYRAKGLLDRFDFTGNGRRLLIVSFTNQARDNISERLKKYTGIQTLRRHVTICNFHGLAARIINAHGSIIGLDSEWTVANFDWVKRVIQTLECSKDMREQVASTLQKAKLECITDDDVMVELQALDGLVGGLATSIEKARIKEKIVTYDDQIRTALWILQDERVARLYRNHFFAAIVDEFQDLTPQQLQIVETLCGENVTYAGDLAQSIFSFAGADAQFTHQEITKNHRRPIKLLKSFRSAPVVLNAVNSLSPLTGSEQLTAAFPEHWGDGGLLSFVSFVNQDDEAKWVIQKCKLILSHCPDQRVGIIARTAFRANLVKRTLSSQGINFADWGDGLFRPETAKTLRSICDDISGKSFKRQLDLFLYIKQRAVAIQDSPSEELVDACGWLFDQVRQSDSSGIPDIKKRINEQRGNETIASRAGIHCLTGHAGKGQQFDWVFIVGLEQGTIPFYKAQSADEKLEEARVLSVMISRARIGVIATYASSDLYGHDKTCSEFLSYLRGTQGFLSDRGQIESWFAQADWPIIGMM